MNNPDPSSYVQVISQFVRGRNALLIQAKMTPLYLDYYLHLGERGISLPSRHDQIFKRALAAITLHAVSRPRSEIFAWTINFQSPLVNLFVAANNPDGSVIGNYFSEDIKELPSNLLLSEVAIPGQEPQRSIVSFDGEDPLNAAEHFYLQSEQRPGRFFEGTDEDFFLLAAQPGCDLAWLNEFDPTKDDWSEEEIAPLEQRLLRWWCGCHEQKILSILAAGIGAKADEIFGDQEVLRVQCPRCGKKYSVSREVLEAFHADTENAEHKPLN